MPTNFTTSGESMEKSKASPFSLFKKKGKNHDSGYRITERMDTVEKMNAKKKKGGNQKRKREKEPNQLKLTVAESVPYLGITEDGIMLLENGMYSRSYIIPDVNFLTVSRERQKDIVLAYTKMISSFAPDVQTQITLYNKTIDDQKYQETLFFKMRGDKVDDIRQELNEHRRNKMFTNKNNIELYRCITVALPAPNESEARNRFTSEIEFTMEEMLGSAIKGDFSPLTALDRCEIINSMYHPGDTLPLVRKRVIGGQLVESFTLENCRKQGISSRDVIAPIAFDVTTSYVDLGGWFAKSYYVASWPTSLKGDILTSFMSLPFNLIVNTNVRSWNSKEAMDFLKEKRRNISGDVMQKQIDSGGRYDANIVNPDADEALKEVGKLQHQITHNDSRLLSVSVSFTVFAPDKEKLYEYDAQLNDKCASMFMTVRTANTYQEEALNNAIPFGYYGYKGIVKEREMESYSFAMLTPFTNKSYAGYGIMMGTDAKTKAPVMVDVDKLTNAHMLIIGKSGAGKSFISKLMIAEIVSRNGKDIVYGIDPLGEFGLFIEALDGTVITISGMSQTHINPFDLSLDVDADTDPIMEKCNFVLKLCRIMLGDKFGFSVGPNETTIINETSQRMYTRYADELRARKMIYDPDSAPTIITFYNELLAHHHPKAKDIAFQIKSYVDGPFAIFSHRTNINLDNNVVIFDTSKVEENLQDIANHICLDYINSRMMKNFKRSIRTWVFVDEIHRMLKKEESAAAIIDAWKVNRHYGGAMIGITQDVGDFLVKQTSEAIVKNSQTKLILRQDETNISQITHLFHLSSDEEEYIRPTNKMTGILAIGDENIPLDMKFPTDTDLYHLISTKPFEN